VARGGGANFSTSTNSVVECLDYCVNTASCVGVGVNVAANPIQCSPHSDAADFIDSNLYARSSTDTYQLVTRCASTVAPTAARQYTPSSFLESRTAIRGVLTGFLKNFPSFPPTERLYPHLCGSSRGSLWLEQKTANIRRRPSRNHIDLNQYTNIPRISA